MGQQWKEFASGRAFSTAIDDFKITLHGNALEVGRFDRERVRQGDDLKRARERIVRQCIDHVTRVTELSGDEHAAARLERVAAAYQGTASRVAHLNIDRHAVCVVTRNGRLLVWDAEDGEPSAPPEPVGNDVVAKAIHVTGRAVNIGRWTREEIPFEQWREGEVVEATIDGQEVKLRRAGWRIQVWGASDLKSLPYVPRMAPLAETGTREDYEIVADGGALAIGRLDREMLRREGDEHAAVRMGILEEALASIHADRQIDGWRDRRMIDGIDCAMRRDGWRLQVWGAGESEPDVDPMPPPHGADAPGLEVPTARIKVADFDLGGKQFAPINNDNSAETQSKRRSLLEKIGEAERAGDDKTAMSLKAEFVATYHKPAQG